MCKSMNGAKPLVLERAVVRSSSSITDSPAITFSHVKATACLVGERCGFTITRASPRTLFGTRRDRGKDVTRCTATTVSANLKSQRRHYGEETVCGKFVVQHPRGGFTGGILEDRRGPVRHADRRSDKRQVQGVRFRGDGVGRRRGQGDLCPERHIVHGPDDHGERSPAED